MAVYKNLYVSFWFLSLCRQCWEALARCTQPAWVPLAVQALAVQRQQPTHLLNQLQLHLQGNQGLNCPQQQQEQQL